MAKSGARVGIDLEQASIAGVQVKGAGQGYSLTNVSVRALPEGLVFEGEVVDVDAFAAELKAFWKESGFTGKRFSLGVANQKIVVRTMEFPIIDAKELARHRVPGAGGHPDPARGCHPRFPGAGHRPVR